MVFVRHHIVILRVMLTRRLRRSRHEKSLAPHLGGRTNQGPAYTVVKSVVMRRRKTLASETNTQTKKVRVEREIISLG